MDYAFLPKTEQATILTERMKQLEKVHLERSQVLAYARKSLAVAKTKAAKETAKQLIADSESELVNLDLAYGETFTSYQALTPGPPPNA